MLTTESLREYAKSCGIDLLGVTSAAEFVIGDDRPAVSPDAILPGARSVVAIGCYMYKELDRPRQEPGKPRGRAGFLWRNAKVVRAETERLISEALQAEGYRTAGQPMFPLKQAAVRSGIATWGKNGLVQAPGFGSCLQLGCVITDAPLEATNADVRQTDCGTCRACVDACQTGALDQPYSVNRGRCMSLMLGMGAPVPAELRTAVGDCILRCSACQDACPKNHGLAPRARQFDGMPDFAEVHDLIPLLDAGEDHIEEAFCGFADMGLPMFRRNVALAIGNVGDAAAIPALVRAAESEHAELRETAQWAIERIQQRDGSQA